MVQNYPVLMWYKNKLRKNNKLYFLALTIDSFLDCNTNEKKILKEKVVTRNKFGKNPLEDDPSRAFSNT